jgi:hypothetical protein
LSRIDIIGNNKKGDCVNNQEYKKFVFAGVFRRHGGCKNRLFAPLSLFPIMPNKNG